MPWINGKFWYTRDKIVTSEQCFYNMPAPDPSATNMLVVNPTTHEIGTRDIASVVGSGASGNNMWYESWHMTTEGISSTLKYADVGKKVFYHGFRADTTGEYTNMKVRIENTSGSSISLIMNVAIYDSINTSGTVIDSSPYPNVLKGQGNITFPLTSSNYGSYSYLDIPFDSPISVTRGNIYFVALFYNDGIDGLFGLGDNNTSSGTYHLSYSSVNTSVSSFVSTIPSSGSVEPNSQAAYWYTLYGLQSAAGAIQGSTGPAGPSTGSVSFYTDYGSKTNNLPPTFNSAPKLIANGNNDVTNGQNSTGMKGYAILPHGVGGQASATGSAYSGLIDGTVDRKPMIYGSYMHRSGRIVGVGTNVHYEDAGLNGTPTTIEPYVAVYGGAGGSAYESKVGNWVYNWGGSTNATTPTTGNPPERGHYGSANLLAKDLRFKAGDYIGIYVPEDNSGTSTTAPYFSVEGTLYLVFD